MAESSNSIPAPTANPVAFDPGGWLSRFESIGVGFLATETQVSICIAYQGTTRQQQAAANAMVADLTDDHRAAVIAHIRSCAAKPDLNAIPLEKLSEPAGTEPVSSDAPLIADSKGSSQMDMSHTFQTAPANLAEPISSRTVWDAAMAARNNAEAASDRYDLEIFDPAYEREKMHGSDYAVPDEVHDQHQRLVDEFVDAETVLMEIPAPDGPALAWKLNKLFEPESECTPCWSMFYVHQTIADYHRLLLGQIATDCRLDVEADARSPMVADLQRSSMESARRVDRATWDAAMTEFQEADAAYDGYSDKIKIPDEIIDRDRKTFIALMNTPAPDEAALRWKLNDLLEDLPEDSIGTTLADLDRFLGTELPVENPSSPGAQADSAWLRIIADFKATHAAYAVALDFEEKASDAFHDACASLPPEPEKPGTDLDILDMTIREIRAASDKPERKAAWAEYERSHANWKAQRDALHEQIVGPAKAAYDQYYSATSQALDALAAFSVTNLSDLGEKIEIIAKEHAGFEIPPVSIGVQTGV